MFTNRTLWLKIAGSRTINRKALRLVVQLVTISKDQPWVINMCWLVSGSCLLGCSHAIFSMSWHTIQFTMYRMAKGSILWSSGAGIVFFFFSHSHKISCPLICKETIDLNWQTNNQYSFIWFSKMLLPRPKTHFYKYNFKPDLIKHV